MVDSRTLGLEWSRAYVSASSRLDKQSMLYLLGLVSWPPLTSMYGDLVDDLTLICTLLSKKPMVGYLVARRLQLQEEKTHTLLSVLEAKGYIKAVGSHLQGDPYVFSSQQSELDRFKSKHLHARPTLESGANVASSGNQTPEAEDTAAILKQLWRVLNTDISLNRGTSDKALQATTDTQAETSDVLGQLWRVLNTDIVLKKSAEATTAPDLSEIPVPSKVRTEAETADVMSQLWRVLNTEIAIKRQSTSDPNDKADVTGEAAAVMSQLWRVLNTEIAFKRKVNQTKQLQETGADVTPEKDTGHEAADRLGQLWRVLNTEIALKKQAYVDVGLDEATDTTGEASDRLTQLWRILNAEITVTLPPERKK